MRAKSSDVLAILASDLHGRPDPPIARSSENWYVVQDNYYWQARELCKKHNAPFVVAGDFCHHWKLPPETINFLIAHIPQPCYGIPGQHDLPFHRYSEMGKSAYWTLCQAGIVKNLPPKATIAVNDKLALYGFPWGFPPSKCHYPIEGSVNLAVVHAYCWKKGRSYPGAPASAHYQNFELDGYDAAVFGDNHQSFLVGKIYNSGTFIRTKRDEIDYKPTLGLLMSDGTITRHYLDTTTDKFEANESTAPVVELDMTDFLHQLTAAGDGAVSFTEAIKQWHEKENTPESVQHLLQSWLESRMQ